MVAKDISKEELKDLYNRDFPLWAEINLQLLKEKAYELVDWENLLEEIEDIGTRHLESCISYLAVILEHLYKIDNLKDIVGGETAGKSWIRSVLNSRSRIEIWFDIYQSLKSKLQKEVDTAWKISRRKLEIWLRNNDYNPEDFDIPVQCPYTYQEAMERKL
ncbi:MAG: DUF29 domain-containing protein [Hydrogenothermaceae bacterium]